FGHFNILIAHLTKVVWFWARGEMNPFYLGEIDWFYGLSQWQHEFAYIMVSITETFLIVERFLAVYLSDRYKTSRNPRIMSIVISAIMFFSCGFAYILHFTTLKLALLLSIEFFDIASLVSAYFCHRYTRKQYRETLLRTLADKYQLRDVAALSSALIPI
ncbi:hypothetical protein PENTCL1PPCAC_22172, partial [Pristionchus entomophagus]